MLKHGENKDNEHIKATHYRLDDENIEDRSLRRPLAHKKQDFPETERSSGFNNWV